MKLINNSLFEFSQKQITIIETIGFFIIFTSIWGNHIISNYDFTKLIYIFDSMLLCVFFFVNNKHASKHKFTKALFMVEFFSLSLIIMGIRFELPGNIAQGIVIGIVFPIYYLSLKPNLFKSKINTIINSASYSFYLLLILSLVFAPNGDIRYRGILTNTNTLAEFASSIFLLSLYAALVNNKKKMAFNIITSILSGGVVFFTQSRAAILTIIVSCVIWGVYYLVFRKIQKIFRRILLIFIASIVCVPILSFATSTLPFAVLSMEEELFDAHFLIYNYQYGSEYFDYNDELGSNTDKINNRMTDFSSSGRSDLWKLYGAEIGLDGHDKPIEFNAQFRTAHNAYVQVAYSFGFLAGLALLLFNLYIGVISIKKNHFTEFSFFRLIIIVNFGMYSMVETVYFPFSQSIALLYWIIIVSLIRSDFDEVNISVCGNRASRMPGTSIPETGNR